jgi:hypothetical protein
MTTLVEFLDPLRKAGQPDQALAVLFYLKHEEALEQAQAGTVRQGLERARISGAKKMNVSRALGKCGSRVDRDGQLWSITTTGEDHVRQLLALPDSRPQAQHDVQSLEKLAVTVENEAVRGYIQEAILCLQVGAFRAAIVFLWTGAVATLREEVWKQKSNKEIQSALQAHRQNAKFRKKEDFAYVQDSELLQIAFDLSLIDKTEKGMLSQNLDLRNGCGHPTKFNPREKKTSSFIEDVVGIVFTQ